MSPLGPGDGAAGDRICRAWGGFCAVLGRSGALFWRHQLVGQLSAVSDPGRPTLAAAHWPVGSACTARRCYVCRPAQREMTPLRVRTATRSALICTLIHAYAQCTRPGDGGWRQGTRAVALCAFRPAAAPPDALFGKWRRGQHARVSYGVPVTRQVAAPTALGVGVGRRAAASQTQLGAAVRSCERLCLSSEVLQ